MIIKKPKVGDRFLFYSTNNLKYQIEVVNINTFREPDIKYALEVSDEYGQYADDYQFVGDKFFENNADKMILL